MKLTRTTRNAGWLVVAGLLGVALIAPAATFAGTGPEVTPTPVLSENVKVDDCPARTMGIDVDGKDTSGSAGGVTVSIVYNADDKTTDFEASGGFVMHAYIKGGNAYNDYDYSGMGGIAKDDGLVAPNNPSGGPAGLSHAVFCVVESVESVTTTTTSSSKTTTSSSTTTTKTKTSRSGTVSGETGDPTPPSTDTVAFSSTSSTTGGGWSLLLIAMAGLLAAALLLTPAAAVRKR